MILAPSILSGICLTACQDGFIFSPPKGAKPVISTVCEFAETAKANNINMLNKIFFIITYSYKPLTKLSDFVLALLVVFLIKFSSS
ncbi:hypothetical protein [Francisella-like endosymbiont]|uniref:hypothetical protein n=1 Tax=Francisella-like endosymbiont TaxID=512373 RepID=UPI0029700967